MKSRLKTIILSAVAVVSAFSAVTYTSCNNDKCQAIVCSNGGVCSQGACLCQAGYEGPQCEKVSRTRFTGPPDTAYVWHVLETGTLSTTANYTIAIKNGANITDILIVNFRNSVKGLVSAYVKKDSFFIPEQTVDGKTIVGSGVISQNLPYNDFGSIVLNYRVTDTMTHLTDEFGLDSGQPSHWNR
ncbi:MAG: calcium-binding EGF-like domain-containing protein [Bacteroidota bacterium]